MKTMILRKTFSTFLTTFPIIISCHFQEHAPSEIQKENLFPEFPDVHFTVASDLHFYDPSLGVDGPAFEEYVKHDRKMLSESTALNRELIQQLKHEKPRFLIVTGDLTKDGERINHERVASLFADLQRSGTDVYVIPGNHDIANGASVQFRGDETLPVPSVTPAEFRGIYNRFGYDRAFSRDRHSLSYAVEPVPGLILLALDSNIYGEYETGKKPETNGRLRRETLLWIEAILFEAREKRKGVIVAMHHGIVEHYPDNENLYGEYVLENHGTVAELFARYNVRTIFTGHFHAQDITAVNFPGTSHPLYDIETGSLLTYPNAFRSVRIKNGAMEIRSKHIQSINGEEGLPEKSKKVTLQGIANFTGKVLRKFFVSEKDIADLSFIVSEAYLTHVSGDEKPMNYSFDPGKLGLMGSLIWFLKKGTVFGWTTDLPPGDNNLKIFLSKD